MYDQFSQNSFTNEFNWISSVRTEMFSSIPLDVTEMKTTGADGELNVTKSMKRNDGASNWLCNRFFTLLIFKKCNYGRVLIDESWFKKAASARCFSLSIPKVYVCHKAWEQTYKSVRVLSRHKQESTLRAYETTHSYIYLCLAEKSQVP